MEVSFRTTKIKKLCENSKKLKKEYGAIQSEKIISRINDLEAAKSLYDIYKLPYMRLHKLEGKLRGLCSIDIKHPYRIYIKPLNGDILDYKTITEVEINRIHIDPH